MTTAQDSPVTDAREKTSKFAAPGEGSSTAISAVTIVAIVALWWLASHRAWVPPLFLPTPETVAERLYESAMGKLKFMLYFIIMPGL